MATTTPNFGWSVPTSSDLVKNGATAIETLGDSIDASLVDLKGGTTGQVLAKASGTDMDFSWVTDATGIPATIFDAKGDIIAASAADTASRLAVGTNNQVLTADSSTATGLKWATPASSTPTFVGCRLTSSVNPTFAASTYTAVTWDGEAFDTDGFHSTVTNTSRITIPAGKAGKYYIQGLVDFDNNATGVRQAIIRENNTTDRFANVIPASIQYPSGEISGILNLTVGDYVELWVIKTSTSSQQFFLTQPNGTFSATYLGA